jgi:hypothetical protein
MGRILLMGATLTLAACGSSVSDPPNTGPTYPVLAVSNTAYHHLDWVLSVAVFDTQGRGVYNVGFPAGAHSCAALPQNQQLSLRLSVVSSQGDSQVTAMNGQYSASSLGNDEVWLVRLTDSTNTASIVQVVNPYDTIACY